MGGNKQSIGWTKLRHGRKVKVAPMTQAVRSALAASAMAFALTLGSGAMAANPASTSLRDAALAHKAAWEAFAPVADLTTVAPGDVEAVPPELFPTAISEYGPGDIVIDNATPILENQTYDAVAIYAYSTGGNVDITNQAAGGLQALSSYSNAIGIYGYALDGNVDIDNEGEVFARSVYGLADGIFASGTDVDVTNSGDITAVSVYGGWAAGIEAQATDLTTVQNDGSIYASAAYGLAFGIYATGGDVVVGNAGGIAAFGYYATGIEAQSTGDVSVDNSGDIVAGSISTYYNPYTYGFYVYGSALATGINAGSNGEGAAVSVTNSGDISAVSYFGGAAISATSGGQGGTASVSNSGNIYASQYTKYGYGAYGIVTSADGDSSIDNSGMVDVASAGAASGLAALSFAGDASVTNAGDISVYSSAALGYTATGITAFAANGNAHVDNSGSVDATAKYWASAVTAQAQGDVTVENSGSLYADGQKYAFGVYAVSNAGDLTVHNEEGGEIGFYSYLGRGWGVFGYAGQGDVHVANDGVIAGYAYGQSAGVFALAGYGDVAVDNTGSIEVVTGGNVAVGAFARADYGTAGVTNSGDITASTFGGYYTGYSAYGVLARGAYAEVANSGSITAEGYYYGTGIAAISYYGTSVHNTGGSIDVYAVGGATGIDALSVFGDVTVDNASDITAIGLVFGAQGLRTYSFYGDVEIDNSGDIYAASLYGDAIGIYGYSLTGDVSIHNTGDITTYSYAGLADGIFASGANVDVTNSGAIESYGYTWSAGVEAQGSESVSVDNAGDITSGTGLFVQVASYYYGTIGYAAGGTAYGIYATGGSAGASVTNSGNIEVQGGYVTGIEVQSGGDIVVSNSGDVVAGSGLNSYGFYDGADYITVYYGTQLAIGINANSNGEGAAVSVTSSGDISADGIFGATGIAATSSGTGGSASVTNSGDIYAGQNQKYGYGAYGIVTSADGDSSIDNSGDIEVYSGGVANGLTALSFAGDASVTNSGDIGVYSAAGLYYAGTGITAFAANGDAHVDNSGSVDAAGKYWASAVTAQAQGDVTVENSGSLYADGQKYAFGVYAVSNAGDVSVHNDGGGEIGFYSYAGRGWGVFAYAGQGDVHVGNDGAISGYAYGQSAGVFAIAGYGDVAVDNTGSIDVTSGGNVAVGAFARADYGTASVSNSGDITASNFGGYYTGYSAYGILARGAYAEVSNSGNITAEGYYYATGIAATSYYGTTVTNTGGSITAYAVGGATGIDASSLFGDVAVDNANDIEAIGLVFGATGINAYSAYGDVDLENSGDIYAASIYGSAFGIYALGESSSVDNAGWIAAVAQGDVARAIGIVNVATQGDAHTGNSGDVYAFAVGGTAPYGVEEAIAVGIYNVGVYYDSVVDNGGTVSATALALDEPVDLATSFFTAKAIGVQTLNVAGYGESAISNSGTIEAAAATSQGFASAWGAVAQGFGLYGDVAISNDGLVSTYAYTAIGTANAIGAYASAVGGEAAIVNNGDIVSVAHVDRGVVNYVVDYSYATGVKIDSVKYYGAGRAALENHGDIEANAYARGGIALARGVQAYAVDTAITNHAGATISATGETGLFGGGFAVGIEAAGAYSVEVVNDGDIDVHGMSHGYTDGVYMFYAGSQATGIDASAKDKGDVRVANSGEINAIAVTDGGITFFNAGAGATGVNAYAKYDATVVNAGDINAIAISDVGVTSAIGAQLHGKYSAHMVNEAGASIVAQSHVQSLSSDTYGGRAIAFGTHTFGSDYATTTNAGHIMVQAVVEADGVANDGPSLAKAWGASIGAYSTSLTGTVANHGDIEVLASADLGYAVAYGVFVNSQYQAEIENSGDVLASASADHGDAFAVGAYANALHATYYVPCDAYGCDYGNASLIPDDGIASLTNAGDVVATASAAGGVGNSYAAVVRGAFGSTVENSGHVIAATEADDAQATAALLASFYGAASLENSGLIQAIAEGSLASATGVNAIGLDGGVYVGNSGQIVAGGYGDDATAIAVRMESDSTNKLVNSGTISALGDGERIAISSEGDAMADLSNRGIVRGAIQSGDLDDRFVNASGGLWVLDDNHSTDFGDGNDTIINQAGGRILLDDGSIYLGGGTANAFTNFGAIKVSGDANLIDMGGDGGTANALAFVNGNVIDFLDGHADDALTIHGDLGGTGALSLDVDFVDESSDQLYVEGSMAANAVQHVNIAFPGMPLVASTSIDFAHVSGNSAPTSFVAGQILGYDPARNFLDLDFSVGSRINAANTTDDVFSIQLDVVGLNDTGALAASVASGAAGFLNSQVGTFRQRLGANPYGDAGSVMSAFVRAYTDEGDVSPDHVAANFGQGGNFAYNQSTWGREIGVNANLFGNFHAGLVLGNADSRQRLTGAGHGENRMDGMTWGAYATWYVPEGFFVDLSGRWMAADVKSTSAAGTLVTRAHTRAVSLEGGYEWKLGGFILVPQLQYTRTEVQDVRTIHGERVDFMAHGGTYSRGRLGVEINKTFTTASGLRWTPYGSLNAIREFDGESTYTVADNFRGSTSVDGTSAMAELGIGVQKGGFGFSIGANWTDGGALDGFVGGQAVFRFAW